MIATDHKLEEVLLYCTEFAQLMLRDSGEFYPFGSTVDATGSVHAVAGYDGERPAPRELYSLLVGVFQSQAAAGTIHAAGLVANVDVPKEYAAPYPDAIRVHLERDGWSRFIYIPYRILTKGFFRKARTVEYAEMIAVEIPPKFFPARAST